MTVDFTSHAHDVTPRENPRVNTTKPPTEKQLEVLRLIYEAEVSRRWPPTHLEMARYLEVTENAVRERLHWLVNKGHVEMKPNIARGCRITGAGIDWVRRYDEVVE